MCYDTDVFRSESLKPINWVAIEERLYQLGVEEIVHVRAEQSIEDWFLCDLEGLRKHLRLPKKFDMTGYNGMHGLTELFKHAGRTYKKGDECKDLISDIRFDVLLPMIEKNIEPLIRIIDKEY